jgi:AraC-like DNA-binding protein
MVKPESGTTRGVLISKTGARKFTHARFRPSLELQAFIEHYWVEKWDLRGLKPYVAETLPFPSVHIVIEKGQTKVHGVVTGKFSRRLQGKGRAFGIKFRPGMFHPFYGASISSLTDRVVDLESIFGRAGFELEQEILAEIHDRRCVKKADSFLRERIPKAKVAILEVRDAVEKVAEDRSIVRAEQVASFMGIGLRPLQRIFSKYVGVSPKWVIQRYRLHEAAEALAKDEIQNMTELSLRLGYFDQAHFIRDFKSVVGATPGAYAKTSKPSQGTILAA